VLAAGDVATAAAWNVITNDVIALNSAAPSDVVTALPGSPIDGQVIYYTADATNGVVWKLRYRSASASAYKWEYVGGNELSSIDLNSRTILTAAVTTFATYTSAPSITAPLAGDYRVMFGAILLNGSSGNTCNARIGVSVAAGAVTNYGIHNLNQTVLNLGVSVAVNALLTGVSATNVIDVRGGSNGFNHTFTNSYLYIRPVRVG